VESIGVTHRDISLPCWPKVLDGFRIVVASDLHIHPAATRMGRRERRLAELLASLDCDAFVSPGDLCNTAAAARVAVDVVRASSPRYGRFITLGNGEHKRCEETTPIIRTLRRAGHVLMNDNVAIEVNGTPVWFLGVDDPSQDYDRLDAAALGVPSGAPRILLAHSPEIVTRLHRAPVDLVICGHTHGGQVCPPNGRALWTQTATLERASLGYGEYGPEDFARFNGHDLSRTRMFVSRGVGTAKLAIRAFCRPEVAALTLWNAA
jgi:hypothetical protein